MFHWMKKNTTVSIAAAVYALFLIGHVFAISLNTRSMYATPTSFVEWLSLLAPILMYYALVCLWLLLVQPRPHAHPLYRLLFYVSLMYLTLIHVVLLVYFSVGYELSLERVRHAFMLIFGSKPIHDLAIYFPLIVLPFVMVFGPLLKRLAKRLLRNRGMSRLGIIFTVLACVYTFFPQQNRILQDAPFVGMTQPLRTLGKAALTNENKHYVSTQKHYIAPTQTPLSQEAFGIQHVVLILLESVSSEAVNHQVNGEYVAAPFLHSIKNKSMLFGDSITVIPSTSKSLVSILCGMYPFVSHFALESLTLPGKCLPELLEENQFESAFFRASTEYMDNHSGLHQQFGFSDIVSPETLVSGNEKVTYTSYAGVDDRYMLLVMKAWLRIHAKEKTFTTLLTNVSHAPYTLPKDIKTEPLADSKLFNAYLNSVKFTDGVVERVFELYKQQGIFDDTLFVIIGDHGESFGEHFQYGHLYNVYQNTISVPFVIYNERMKAALTPSKSASTSTSPRFYSAVDVFPTIADALNITHDAKDGYSALNTVPERLIFSSETTPKLSSSVIDGDKKFIHYFGYKRDDYFDLATDPRELVNRIDQLSAEKVSYYQEVIREWANDTHRKYDAHFKQELGEDYYMTRSMESLPCTFKDLMAPDSLNKAPKEWLNKCSVTSDRHHGH